MTDPFTFGDRIDPLGLHKPDPVDAGWMRRIRHGPMTVDQVLARGLAEMLDQDDAEERQRDPVRYASARRMRHTLLGRLLGRW
jgi:hypothetical protein